MVLVPWGLDDGRVEGWGEGNGKWGVVPLGTRPQ